MSNSNYDFCGWATKNNLKCSDGRTIMKDAFKHMDGKIVPLVWNHKHEGVVDVLGHALLENRAEGVYAYGTFNDTESGQTAKLLVQHGDVDALSIFANQLKQQGPNVIHGNIREVSLVLAGANPGAFIESIIQHGEESDEEGIIYTGENITLSHAGCGSSSSDDKKKKKELEHAKENEDGEEDSKMAEGGKTIGEVFESLDEEQKNAVYALIGQALEGKDMESDEEDEKMKHNVFDNDKNQDEVLSHDAMETIIADGKRYGSLKESFLAHAQEYGIESIITCSRKLRI